MADREEKLSWEISESITIYLHFQLLASDVKKKNGRTKENRKTKCSSMKR